MKNWTLALSALSILSGLSGAAHADDALKAAVAGSQRTPTFVARDVWRHPVETLSFMGIKPDMTVVEISPGTGWYTEILAPYLRDKGQLVLAASDPNSSSEYARRSAERLKKKLDAQPAIYDKVKLGVFEPPAKLSYAPTGSVDLVLTFRNVHNWAAEGESVTKAVFQSMYDALKPGGVLGVVDHRLPPDRPLDPKFSTGYVPVAYVVRIAEGVGFQLAASSEVNANPKDTADHPGGVWALPPTYTHKELDRARYAAIGESDRMTLRFMKP
ncbi:MAG: methyltransferase [Burkholderiales bacterium PBB4]|nr:MAG: methyltransferase [Burkholderiales bacterium PBB4]